MCNVVAAVKSACPPQAWSESRLCGMSYFTATEWNIFLVIFLHLSAFGGVLNWSLSRFSGISFLSREKKD